METVSQFILCVPVQQTTNFHKDSDECIVTELSGLIVTGKVFALPMSILNVLSSWLD